MFGSDSVVKYSAGCALAPREKQICCARIILPVPGDPATTTSDPLHDGDEQLASALHIRMHTWPGAHDFTYWNKHWGDYLGFYAHAIGWFASESMTQIPGLITHHLRGFRHYEEGVFDDRAGTFAGQQWGPSTQAVSLAV